MPAYSTDAVAELVAAFVLALSCSLVPQHRLLWQRDRRNFAPGDARLHGGAAGCAHFELRGKTADTWLAFLEEHPEVQEESQALSSCERNRSFAGRMIFNNAD